MKAYLLQSLSFITEILNVVHCLGTEWLGLACETKAKSGVLSRLSRDVRL